MKNATPPSVATPDAPRADAWDGLTKLPGETYAQRCVRIHNEGHLKHPGDIVGFFAYVDSKMPLRSDRKDR